MLGIGNSNAVCAGVVRNSIIAVRSEVGMIRSIATHWWKIVLKFSLSARCNPRTKIALESSTRIVERAAWNSSLISVGIQRWTHMEGSDSTNSLLNCIAWSNWLDDVNGMKNQFWGSS